MSPLISIIMPVYKSERFVEAAISSILSQSIADFELLLIDDGSPDKSGQICDTFAVKDERIRVFHKENGGVSSARNLGLDNARGTWVTFIDSDDTVESDYFNLKHLDKSDLAIQKWRFTSEKDTTEYLSDAYYEGSAFTEFMQDNMHKDVFRMIAAKFLRRSIIEEHKIRFDTNLRLGEDTVFMLNYYKHINSLSVNNTSFYLYYRPENWGGGKFSITKEEYVYFFKAFYQAYKESPFKSEKLVRFLVFFFMAMLGNENSTLQRLYLNTHIEYLELTKDIFFSSSVIPKTKYFVYKTFSYLTKFLGL